MTNDELDKLVLSDMETEDEELRNCYSRVQGRLDIYILSLKIGLSRKESLKKSGLNYSTIVRLRKKSGDFKDIEMAANLYITRNIKEESERLIAERKLSVDILENRVMQRMRTGVDSNGNLSTQLEEIKVPLLLYFQKK